MGNGIEGEIVDEGGVVSIVVRKIGAAALDFLGVVDAMGGEIGLGFEKLGELSGCKSACDLSVYI